MPSLARLPFELSLESVLGPIKTCLPRSSPLGISRGLQNLSPRVMEIIAEYENLASLLPLHCCASADRHATERDLLRQCYNQVFFRDVKRRSLRVKRVKSALVSQKEPESKRKSGK